jgi:5-methylcytosine-specific restriction endonuclease McrA
MSKKDGLPCKRCGTSKWYENGRCWQCTRARQKEYHQENAEKNRQRALLWQVENKGKHNENNRRYRIKTDYDSSPRRKEYYRQYRKNNRNKANAVNNNRRTKKAQNGGSYTAQEFAKLCEMYENKCLCCGSTAPLTADHVVPISKGGTSYIDNIQPLCKPCNCKKHDKTIDYRRIAVEKRWTQSKLFE